MATRTERLEHARLLLEAVCERDGKVKIWEFIELLQRKIGITRDTATDYWKILKANPDFDNNGFEVYRKVAK